jgi:hypothetical protein
MLTARSSSTAICLAKPKVSRFSERKAGVFVFFARTWPVVGVRTVTASKIVKRQLPIDSVLFGQVRRIVFLLVELAQLPKSNDHLVHRQALSRLRHDFLDYAITLRLQYIFHLHRFNFGQNFAGFDFLSHDDTEMSQ